MCTFITHREINGKPVFCYSEDVSEYHSGSNLRQHPTREIFLPSNLVLLLYALISLVMLALLNINSLWQLLLGEPITAEDVVPLTSGLSTFQDKLSTPIVMVFWLFIGAATYTAIWLAENVFFIAKTEVEESQYISRSPAVHQRYWRSAIIMNLFLLLLALLWISFIALYLRLLLPAYSNLFHDSLFSAPVFERLVNFIGALSGNALSIYLIMIMNRVISYVWRVNRP